AGGAALAAPARELGRRAAEVVYQDRAGARLVDRVEVLARHVLEQRELEPFRALGVADDRRDLLELRDLRSAQAALAGDQLVGPARQRAPDGRLQTALRLDRLR